MAKSATISYLDLAFVEVVSVTLAGHDTNYQIAQTRDNSA